MANNDGQIVLGLDIPKTVKRINEDIKKLQNQLAQIKSTGALDTNSTVKKINAQINALQSQLKTIHINTKLDTSGANKTVQQTGQQIEQAVADAEALINSFSPDSIISKNSAIVASDKERTVTLNQVKAAYDQLNDDPNQYYNLNKQTELSTDIQNWLSQNSHASKEAKDSLNAYYRELSGGQVSVDRLDYIRQELNDMNVAQQGLGKLGKILKAQFNEASASLTQWLSLSSGIMALVYQLKRMPKEVVEVNSAMVELNKVSGASASDIRKYFDEAAESAKKLGTSVSDLITATADWSRLGYNLSDSKKLAEAAALYKNIGDNIEIDAANKALLSALQGFKLEADDAMHIIDAFNEVANYFAIGSDGIGEALRRSAASMYDAGNTLEETIGLVTAANAVVQDPDSIETAYKTISMRIHGAKTEMEGLGLETDGMLESTTALREEIMALSGVDIMKDRDAFKSTYQILDELATKWRDLTDIQQDSIAELIAGKSQSNILSALIANFETARQATEAAVNSTGSALKEQEAYEQGIQYSLDRLEASYQTFANHVLDSDLLKGIIDLGNGVINVLDSVTNSFGTLTTIGAGAGLTAFIKNFA